MNRLRNSTNLDDVYDYTDIRATLKTAKRILTPQLYARFQILFPKFAPDYLFLEQQKAKIVAETPLLKALSSKPYFDQTYTVLEEVGMKASRHPYRAYSEFLKKLLAHFARNPEIQQKMLASLSGIPSMATHVSPEAVNFVDWDDSGQITVALLALNAQSKADFDSLIKPVLDGAVPGTHSLNPYALFTHARSNTLLTATESIFALQRLPRIDKNFVKWPGLCGKWAQSKPALMSAALTAAKSTRNMVLDLWEKIKF